MSTWNITLAATLDRAPADLAAYQLGREIAGGGLLGTGVHGTRFSVTAQTDGEEAAAELARLTRMFAGVVTEHGYRVEAWEAVECLSAAEVERRLSTASMPALVDVEQFAQLCGVTKQRIYELETTRRKRAAAGEASPFPTPVVPGWWIRAAAEHYAATRKTTPGPEAAARLSAIRRRAGGGDGPLTPQQEAARRRLERGNPAADDAQTSSEDV